MFLTITLHCPLLAVWRVVPGSLLSQPWLISSLNQYFLEFKAPRSHDLVSALLVLGGTVERHREGNLTGTPQCPRVHVSQGLPPICFPWSLCCLQGLMKCPVLKTRTFHCWNGLISSVLESKNGLIKILRKIIESGRVCLCDLVTKDRALEIGFSAFLGNSDSIRAISLAVD